MGSGYGGYDANNDGKINFADKQLDMVNGGGAGGAGDYFYSGSNADYVAGGGTLGAGENRQNTSSPGGWIGRTSNAIGATPSGSGIRATGIARYFDPGREGAGSSYGGYVSQGEGSEGRRFLPSSAAGDPNAPRGIAIEAPEFSYVPSPAVTQFFNSTPSYTQPSFTPYSSQVSRLNEMLASYLPQVMPMQTSYNYGGYGMQPPAMAYGQPSYGYGGYGMQQPSYGGYGMQQPSYGSYGGYGGYGMQQPSASGFRIAPQYNAYSTPSYGYGGKGGGQGNNMAAGVGGFFGGGYA
jgi:hypothetical protein